MESEAELSLPDELRQSACRSNSEWGWPPELIPRVITEAEKLGLLSVGGQLQFLLPSGTCECYWVDVDPLSNVPDGLPWSERVSLAAAASLRGFDEVRTRFDFIAEGRKAFAKHFESFETAGGDLAKVMCFIWYLEKPAEG
jgi:hypothetical protein